MSGEPFSFILSEEVGNDAQKPYSEPEDDFSAYRLAPTLQDPASFSYGDDVMYQQGSPDNLLLFFPQKADQPAQLSWNMPGAFNTPDAMDLDPSPPFTVDLELYIDAATPANDGAEPAAAPPENNPLAPTNDVFIGPYDDSAMQSILTAADRSPPLRFNFNEAPSHSNLHDSNSLHPDSLHKTSPYTGEGYGSENTFYDGLKDDALDARRDIHSHRTSILVANDLLPLTTTTSLTPSVSSLHLAQLSFFSAPQYMRSLFDQPPALIHRGLIDLYSRTRLSIDSLNSGANVPARNQRSLASYFPFMGDRKLPGRQSPPEWSLPQQLLQHRTLIRSIFKSSQPEEDQEPVEEGEAPIEDEDPEKKAKRPRRGLFTRFKTKTADEKDLMSPELKPEEPTLVKQEKQEPVLVKQESNSSGSIQETPAAHLNPQSNPGSLQNISSAGSVEEPNYGALFQGVGKRRTLMKSKRKPEKEKGDKSEKVDIKDEDDSEKQSLSLHRASLEHGLDNQLATSASVSVASSHSTESHLEGTPGPFASASKRILGSRLLKRKSSTNRVEPLSDVVEIDLKSLDLPANTEILPQINPKNRTRGRKEDKEADMVDQSKIYMCGYCSRRFKRQEHLKRHFRSLHTLEKPYECRVCLKKFSRTDNLNQHLKVHKQEGDYFEEEDDDAESAMVET